MSIAENLKGAAAAAGSDSPNPYVFLVGCPRSGTTLAKRMLDAHPRIAITRETHWITRFFRKHIGLTDDGIVTPALLDELLAYKRFPHLHLDEADVRALVTTGEPMHYTAFVSAVFDLYGRREGKPGGEAVVGPAGDPVHRCEQRDDSDGEKEEPGQRAVAAP